MRIVDLVRQPITTTLSNMVLLATSVRQCPETSLGAMIMKVCVQNLQGFFPVQGMRVLLCKPQTSRCRYWVRWQKPANQRWVIKLNKNQNYGTLPSPVTTCHFTSPICSMSWSMSHCMKTSRSRCGFNMAQLPIELVIRGNVSLRSCAVRAFKMPCMPYYYMNEWFENHWCSQNGTGQFSAANAQAICFDLAQAFNNKH